MIIVLLGASGAGKSRIERELSYLAQDYADDFYDNPAAQRQFLIDVLDVLRYICGEY